MHDLHSNLVYRGYKMHCVYKVTDKIWWIGGNERKLSVFEGAIPMNGVQFIFYR